MQNPDKRCRACGAPLMRKARESASYYEARKYCDRSCYAAFYNAKPAWQAFAEKATQTEGGCIEWTGYRDRKGYGRYSGAGKEVLAHRIAYVMHYGSIPAGMHIMHRCDNPACCNPQHLFAGTNSDNMADMKAKGRSAKRFGAENANYRHGRNCRDAATSPKRHEIEAHRNGA